MFGISMDAVQSHVDKKISQAHNLIVSKFALKIEVQSLQSQLIETKSKLTKLYEYLGVEYSEKCIKGFTKVTKTKKK